MKTSIRQAVSIVLHRPSSRSVYLVRRNPALRFFGDFWAFPGGALHRVDEELSGRARGAPQDLAVYRVAAVRECFEELGLTLGTSAFDPEDRARLIEDAAHFAAILGSERHIEGAALRPWIRLLTPPFNPIRFDTVFFGVDAEAELSGLEPSIVAGELVEGEWSTPDEWLARWRRGEILIAPPVVLMLRILAAHEDASALKRLRELERGFAAGEIHPIHYNAAVQLLPLQTPTLPPATHTNAYLIGSDPAYLVDPATPHEEEQERLRRAVDAASAGGCRPRAILLTHHHPDHVGAVEFARRTWGLPVWAHRITADLLRGRIAVDRTLENAEMLPLGHSPDGRPGWALECIFTPGHAAGHLCFLERRYGSLICGDMMSTLSSILVHPDDGDMAQYVDSLRRLAAIEDVRVVFPAHGPAAATGRRAIVEQIEHREARERAIAEAISGGAADVESIVSRVYADVPESMHGYAALSVRSVLRKLAADGDEAAAAIRA